MKNKNIFLVTCQVFVVIIIFLCISVRAHYDSRINSKVCTTEECKKAASKILEKMDVNVSPCDNFYKFTCGKFLKEAVIPEDQEDMFQVSFVDAEKDVYQKIENIFMGLKTNDSKTSLLVSKYYKSCMNTSEIENRGLDPLKNILKNLGGWPVLMGEKWSEADFEWDELVNKVQKLGYGGIDILSVIVDDSEGYKIYLRKMSDINSIDRSKDMYNYMLQMAKILGADENEASKQLKESLEFEIELARIYSNNSLPHEQMSISELEQRYPSIRWLKYINNNVLAPNSSVNRNEIIEVRDPNYFSKLELLLSKTSKRTLANYILWKIIDESVDYLNDKARSARLAYLGVEETRDKKCWAETFSTFKIKASSLFVKKYFNTDSKKLALEMVSNIQQELINNLKNISLMDEVTKKKMITKVEAIEKFIGYPDELLDDEKIDEIYQNLKIDADDYFGNAMRVRLANLNEPSNIFDWKFFLDVTSNFAHYHPEPDNKINLPTGCFQGVFFNKDLPMYMNYGGIGTIIGHEILHSLDGFPSPYDLDGNLMEWENSSNYKEKSDCLINQYNNFTVPEANMTLNGENTLIENSADNGGYKMSYLAYNNWTKLQGSIVEPQLPGLDYTPWQMFWISLGNTLCTKYRKEELVDGISSGEHSPFEYRILGSLMNSNEFSKDFNCSSESKMNPKNKCYLW